MERSMSAFCPDPVMGISQWDTASHNITKPKMGRELSNRIFLVEWWSNVGLNQSLKNSKLFQNHLKITFEQLYFFSNSELEPEVICIVLFLSREG